MKITATPCKAGELKPGELFSFPPFDPPDINTDDDRMGIAVWIRTAAPWKSVDDKPGMLSENMPTLRVAIEAT